LKGKQTVIAFTQMDLVIYCQPTPLAKLKIRIDTRTRNVFLQHDIYEVNKKLFEIRRAEREAQRPLPQINDPVIENNLKQSLLLQHFYRVLKQTAVVALKSKGFSPSNFYTLDHSQILDLLNNTISLKQVA
jgi:site-specific recombinase XerD